MKTKQIKGQCDILLVSGFPKELPPDVVLKMLSNQRPEMKGENWQFHCRLSEMTEEQTWQLVSKYKASQTLWKFCNYNNLSGLWFNTGKESFQSLLEANGVMKENMIKRPNGEDYYYEINHGPDGAESLWDGGSYNEDLQKWQQAEANVFNPETTLVFIKTAPAPGESTR